MKRGNSSRVKVSRTLLIILALIFLSANSLAFSLISSFNSVNLIGGIAYLPIVFKQKTPTPLPTPTLTSTPGPKLIDGYYLAEFSNGGFIQFTVSNNGTIASNASFLYQSVVLCPWGSYVFDGTKPIDNGTFSYFEVDLQYREPLASLSCHSLSSTEASCHARRYGLGTNCGGVSGIATWRH
jgi:hypothetical protein